MFVEFEQRHRQILAAASGADVAALVVVEVDEDDEEAVVACAAAAGDGEWRPLHQIRQQEVDMEQQHERASVSPWRHVLTVGREWCQEAACLDCEQGETSVRQAGRRRVCARSARLHLVLHVLHGQDERAHDVRRRTRL